MIERAVALARVEKPSYAQLYDFLEPLFLLRAEVKEEIRLDPPPVAAPGTVGRKDSRFSTAGIFPSTSGPPNAFCQ